MNQTHNLTRKLREGFAGCVLAGLLITCGGGGGGNGNSPSSKPTITVQINPSAALLSAGDFLTFTATVGGTSNQQVVWSVSGPGNPGAISATGVYSSPSLPGTFHVYAKSIEDQSSLGSSEIKVFSLPNATITAPATAYLDGVPAAASVPSQDGASFAWTISNGSFIGAANGASVQFAPSVVGSIRLDCTVVNGAGRRLSATQFVEGHFLPPSITSFSASVNAAKAGEIIQLLPAFANGIGRITPGIGEVASGASVPISPSSDTKYTLTVTNPEGVSTTAVMDVRIYTGPVAIQSFSASAQTVPFGQPVSLAWTLQGTADKVSLNGNSVDRNLTNLSVFPRRLQSYQLDVSNPFGSDKQSLTVRVPGLDLLSGNTGGLGTTDGVRTQARFIWPQGIAANSQGDLFVSESNTFYIRKISADGTVTHFAGSGVQGWTDGAKGVGQLLNPASMATDSAGNIYVADIYGVRKIDPGGSISTLAGSYGSFGLVDGSGKDARFNSPWGLAVDSNGNVFVSDTGNHAIRKITPGGQVTTIAGTGKPGKQDGPAAQASFFTPRGIAVDGLGNVFIADGGQTIRMITADGQVVTLAGHTAPNDYFPDCGTGDGDWTDAGFCNPYGLAICANGDLLVADSGNSAIKRLQVLKDSLGYFGRVVTLAGSPQGFAMNGYTDGQGTNARFDNPRGLAIAPNGDAFVADFWNSVIRQVTPDGLVSTYAGAAQIMGNQDGPGESATFTTPWGVAVGPDGMTYVADNSGVLRTIDLQGNTSTLADPTGAKVLIDGAQGIAVGLNGDLFVVSNTTSTVWKVTPNGVPSLFAGGLWSGGDSDGPGTTARFKGPWGLCADSRGNLFVADTYNHTIRKIDSAGTVSTLCGSSGLAGSQDGVGANARFSYPSAIAVDQNGVLYVADGENHAIRKILTDGTVTTLAGAGVRGSQDGTGTSASFAFPTGLAVTSSGEVYVADNNNGLVRRVSATGVVTTLAGDRGSSGIKLGPLPGSLMAPKGIAVTPWGDLVLSSSSCVLSITMP